MTTHRHTKSQEVEPNALFLRYVSGDHQAFDQLVGVLQGGLLRFASGLLHDHDAAQDIVQETFMRLIRSAAKLQQGVQISPWLYKTCKNLAVDYIRKERSVNRLNRQNSALAQPDPPSVHSVVEHAQDLETVRDRLRKLTDRESTCIVLKLVEGKSYREISQITGLSTSNVGFQIHNGLKRLAAFVRATED